MARIAGRAVLIVTGTMIISGALAIAAIGLFISVTRLCYRIEARSDDGKSNPLPRFANLPRVVINYQIARDDETQAMRRTLLIRIVFILVILAVLAMLRNATPPTLPTPLV